jgi:hypothetical protein
VALIFILTGMPAGVSGTEIPLIDRAEAVHQEAVLQARAALLKVFDDAERVLRREQKQDEAVAVEAAKKEFQGDGRLPDAGEMPIQVGQALKAYGTESKAAWDALMKVYDDAIADARSRKASSAAALQAKKGARQREEADESLYIGSAELSPAKARAGTGITIEAVFYSNLPFELAVVPDPGTRAGRAPRIGVHQNYLQRLGEDPTIPGMGRRGLTQGRYAAGG